ncbi:MAG: molybdopterin-dependent oxidoreductase, partial [Bryobacteraceae bacterium]
TPHGTRELALDAIQRLPRVEVTTELRCIEGWTKIVHWTGARFADFAARYAPDARQADYAGLETPDGEYYVGLEMASALHPQTLLAYQMNGSPLAPEHGAPLRLVAPVKYGIKSIKRVGRIHFAGARPADYWAERGYDWYAGL